MKAHEIIVVGLVVFIALVVTDLWMEQQRLLITQELYVSLATPMVASPIISGFAGAA